MREGKKGQKTCAALSLTVVATQLGVGSELQKQIAPQVHLGVEFYIAREKLRELG